MAPPWKLEGLVLAGGRSRRAGGRKARARLGVETFLARAVSTLRASGCSDVTVVVGPDAEDLRALAPGARWVVNADPDAGMLRSLQLGLADVAGRAPDGVVVALIDHPHVEPQTVRALVEQTLGQSAAVGCPTFEGRVGHPFVLSRAAWADPRLAGFQGTVREFLATLSPQAQVAVADPAVLQDLDTPAAIAEAGGQL